MSLSRLPPADRRDGARRFLDRHWQQLPLWLPQAVELAALPQIGADELAWLATLSGIAPMAAVAACLGALVGLWVLRLVRTARLDERVERPDAA